MKYNKQILGMLVVMGLLLPSVMFASQNLNSKPNGDKFCTNLDTFLVNSEKKLTDRGTKHNTNVQTRETNMATKRAENDKKIAEKRTQAIAKQDAKFVALSVKIKTQEQKQAITEFQATVKNLVSARQTAMDSARDAYRKGVDGNVGERKAKVDEAMKIMKETISTAVAKAKVDCASGSVAEVKTTLKTAIQNARDTFKTTVQGLAKVSESNTILIEARKVAFEKAQNDFKTGLEVAKKVLKEKLGDKEEDNTDTEE